MMHVAQTLPKNLADNADYPNAKFVVLGYGDSDLASYIKSNHGADIASGRLVFYAYETNGAFHMAHAKNMAARCGIREGADILVTQDADNFTGAGFAQYIADNFKESCPKCNGEGRETIPVGSEEREWYTGPPPFCSLCSGSGSVIKTGTFLCPDFPAIDSIPHGPERPPRGYAGRLALRAQDFVKAGGYDEMYDTWRGEDIDMICRLQRMGFTMRNFDNRFLNAVRHNAAIRFKEWPQAEKYEKNRDEIEFCATRTETVVNYGRIGVGTVYRNFDLKPIELPALPTRVFGIGMHKTATTSLDHAFKILGFDSFHFNTGNEARQIWEEMNSAGRSITLEESYALCDNPIPLLYRKLDAAYPGSKFILTVRSEESWLKSVERLWSAEHNPYRWTWDAYPFSHRIHTALYGQQNFDAQVFLERYRRHNAEVREYFGERLDRPHRPGDLLVMDMDSGLGYPYAQRTRWDDLCRFLNVPVPDIPYPTGNQTTANEVAIRNRTYQPNAGFRRWVGLRPFYPCEAVVPAAIAEPPTETKTSWPLCDCGKELWHDGPCYPDLVVAAPVIATEEIPHESYAPIPPIVVAAEPAPRSIILGLDSLTYWRHVAQAIKKNRFLESLYRAVAWIRRKVRG